MPKISFIVRRQIVKEGDVLEANSSIFVLAVFPIEFFVDGKSVKAYEIIWIEPTT